MVTDVYEHWHMNGAVRLRGDWLCLACVTQVYW